MKSTIGMGIMVLGWLLGIYVGGWLMFVKPIIYMAQCFDAGTLSGMIIAISAIKIIFASFVGVVIGWIGSFIGAALL